MRRKFLLMAIIVLCLWRIPIYAEAAPSLHKEEVLPLEKFLEMATENDSEFEQILIDELALHYQKALKLPAKDLVLSVKQQYEFFLDQDRNSPDTTLSLTKLFPYTGTSVNMAYEVGASIDSGTRSSEMTFGVSQPIARNAFGRSTRLLDKIVGLEIAVATHQIIEAYEDYLAFVVTAYYNWYEDYEKLKVGESSYQSNLQLLDNVLDRQNKKIALPIDVNKVKLQLMSKKERLIELQEQYQSSLNMIERIIRHKKKIIVVPVYPKDMKMAFSDFEESFENFQKESRTFAILRKLEKKSKLQVAREADDLLPSVNMLVGYEVNGETYNLKKDNNLAYVGVQLEWPFQNQVDGAEYEIAKIQDRKTQLETQNMYERLYTQLLNLNLQIQREKKLIEIADERITLAESVLKDETKNYSFGKVTINDYILAVNALDTNRFNKITHESLYKSFLVEWMRLTDKLIQGKDIQFKKQ